MADVNRMAISVNSRVMETNENIVAFNAKYIEENSTWLANGGMLSGREAITPAAISEMADANSRSVSQLHSRASSQRGKVAECLEAAKTNRATCLQNAVLIHERRKKIDANRASIQDNQQNVAVRLTLSPVDAD